MSQYVSINSDDRNRHIKKLLILCNLKEAYVTFMEQNLDKLQSYSQGTMCWSEQVVHVQFI
jgi:hypothetical protein